MNGSTLSPRRLPRLTIMYPDLPVFFSDREHVSVLEKCDQPVLAALQENDIGRLDEKKTVHFCGLIHHPENGTVVFLPREAKTGDPDVDLETASLTMRALTRYAAGTSKREYEDEGDVGDLGTLVVLKRLADDFRDHGLYSERVRQQTRNAGKADWVRTVKKEVAMLDRKGNPVFSDIRTSRATRNTDAILAQIQAAVIREIHHAHGWWLSAISSRREELVSCPMPPFPRGAWARKLDAVLPSLYSTRSIFLASHLRFYLRETRNSGNGLYVFGVADFHTIWEAMLRETIVRPRNDSGRNWNRELPKPVYVLGSSGKVDPRSRGMQADIIYEDTSGYTIVDAKYYAAKNAGNAPGWPDIAKQMFYEKALRTLVDEPGRPPCNIRNVFAFPSRTGSGPLGAVEVRRADGYVANDMFPPVTCVYLEMRSVLAYYVNGVAAVLI